MKQIFPVLDCFLGTRSATKPFAEAGCPVKYVEILDGVDIFDYHPPRDYFKFIWGSPPCQEYSQFNRKFSHWGDKYEADRSLWGQMLRVIWEARPRLWIVENVKGAQQVWGKAPYHYGGFFLWGYFPFHLLPKIPWTTSLKGTHADRSKITASGNVFQSDDGKSSTQKAMIPDALARKIYQVAMRFLN